MPINPFQTTAEMEWGGYTSKKSYRGQGQMGAGSLAGQGHRSAANNQGWTVGELKPTPQAKGAMPMGKANVRRADYGQQQTQQPQREGRRASFGGMGPGATKGGGSGMTAGGDIKFDLSIGKTDQRGANLAGARIGAVGMGASASDSNLGDIDQSQTYAPTITGARGGSSRGGAGGAGGSAARGGNTGDTMADFSGVKFGNPTAQIGRNKIGRDTFTEKRTTTNTDARKMPPAKEGTKSVKPDPKKPEAAPAKAPVGKTPAGKEPAPSKPAAKTTTKETKAATKEKTTETKERTAVKEKAKSDLEKATKKTPPPPAATKDKKGDGKGKKTKTAGKVTKEEKE